MRRSTVQSDEVDLVLEVDLVYEVEGDRYVGDDEVYLVLGADLVYVAVRNCVLCPHPEVCRAVVQCETVVHVVDLVLRVDLVYEVERDPHVGPDEVYLVLGADLVYVAVRDCVHYPHPEVCQAVVQYETVVHVVEQDHVERSFPERMRTSGQHSGTP